MNDADQELVEDIALRAAREVLLAAQTNGLLTLPAWEVGTVSGGGPPGSSVYVFIGDEAEAVPVENEVGVPVGDGARVRVLFRPTGGASIVGFAGSGGSGVAAAVELAADDAVISLAVPAGVNEFEVKASLRSNRAATQDSIGVRLNEDDLSTYRSAYLYNNGTTPAAFFQADTKRFYAGECHGANATANRWSPCRIECFNVSGAAHKEGLADSSIAGTGRFANGWLWPKVDPITLIELRPWYGTLWLAGSTARLYVR